LCWLSSSIRGEEFRSSKLTTINGTDWNLADGATKKPQKMKINIFFLCVLSSSNPTRYQNSSWAEMQRFLQRQRI
jgi:hypothetical protein